MLKKMFCAVCALLCLTLCACGTKDGNDSTLTDIVEFAEPEGAGFRNTVLYYSDVNGYIVPIMKQIPWEEGIGKAALNNLKASDENNQSAALMGLTAVVPAEAEFGLRIDDDMCATVDIRNLPELNDAAKERAMASAIVNTLLEFPTIQSVRFTVNGSEVSALSGGFRLDDEYESMSLNVESGDLAVSGSAKPMKLYFANNMGSLNIPVTRYLENAATFYQAVKALVNGPQTDNLICCFPEGTQVLSAYVENGVATVDLSEAFRAAEYTEGLVQAAYETLYLTAQGFAEVSSVKLLIDGEEYEASVELPLYANQFR